MLTKRAVDLAAKACHVSRREIIGKRRYGNVPTARFPAWWLLRSDYSLPQIAAHFGTDHSTVLRGIRHCEQRRAEDADWRDLTDKLRARLG